METTTTCTHCGAPARWADADGEFRCTDCRETRKAQEREANAKRVAEAKAREERESYDPTKKYLTL